MMQFELLIADPPLTKVEQQAYQILLNLRDAQLAHQADDPSRPPLPVLSSWRELLGAILGQHRWFHGWSRALRSKSRRAIEDYYAKYGIPEFRDPLPLANLWQRIESPTALAPIRVDHNDLVFDRFLISQRFGKCPRGAELSYIVCAPCGEEPFRCLLEEPSGRIFVSAERMSRCQPPAPDDFVLYRIRSKAFDLSKPPTGHPTIPTIMELRLPAAYAPWRLMRRKRDKIGETIIE